MNFKDLEKLVINLPERTDRLEVFKSELKYIGSPKVSIMSGVKHRHSHNGIGQAHINCIKYAKRKNLPYILIMEDDVRFQGKEQTLDYINECLDNLPNDWDVLLGGVYIAKDLKEYNQYWNQIGEFCSLHFYIVNEKVYDKILEYDFNHHIDRWYNLNNRLKCYVTKQFIATQYVGISDNVGRKVDYEYKLKNFTLL